MYLEMLIAGKNSFPKMVTNIIFLDECVEKGLDRKNING